MSRRRSRRSLKRPRPRWRRKFTIAAASCNSGVMPRESGASSNHRPTFLTPGLLDHPLSRMMTASRGGLRARSQQVPVAMTDLAQLESQILADIATAGDETALEAVRVAALGKKGSISALLATLGKMSPDERKTQGAAINLAKDKVTQALTARRDVLKSAALDARLASETIDVTLPLRESPAEQGRIHPLSQVFEEVNVIFADMGFAIAEGPDIETDDYNFTKLNFPEGHPAREMHDTFFFNPREDPGSEPGAGGSPMLLRTHTSPVQVRTMLSQK